MSIKRFEHLHSLAALARRKVPIHSTSFPKETFSISFEHNRNSKESETHELKNTKIFSYLNPKWVPRFKMKLLSLC